MASSFFERGVFSVAEGVTSAELGDEVILLNMNSGTYYSLDAVGQHIWEHIQQRSHFGEIYHSLMREFDVEPERCENDLESFLRQLFERGLIESTVPIEDR